MSAAEGSRHGSKHGDSNGRSTNDSPDATDNTDHAAVMSSQQAEDSPASAASSASESDDTTERETTVHLARHGEVLTVRLIESLEAGFANYTWAAARVLAWRILVEQGGSQSRPLHGRTVIELGCGTALPGLVAAQCGARVVLTDADAAGPALQRAQRAAELNGVSDRVAVVPWTWGEWTDEVLALPAPDLILAADCLYALSDYDPFFCAASHLLHQRRRARLLMVYSDRVAGRSMVPFLWRWDMRCCELSLDSLPPAVAEEAEGHLRLYEFFAGVGPEE